MKQQEDKDLLLQVLCAMLPYGVKVRFTVDMSYDTEFDEVTQICDFDGELCSIDCGNLEVKINTCMSDENVNAAVDEFLNECPITIDECKPYLRPMESMTEEELEIYNRGDMTYVEEERYISAERCSNIINFLNSRYLDHNGLIPKGLALEAPEGMYK